MLANLADWIREECEHYGLPKEKISAGAAQGSGRGVCGHVDLGAGGGGHWDPGPNFPWQRVMDMVRGGTGEPKPPKPPPPPPAEGGPVVVNKDGRLEVFAATDNGGVSHRWQEKAGGEWNPKWSGLGQAVTEITFADISQWQPTFDAPAYLKAGHKVIIIRAYSRTTAPTPRCPNAATTSASTTSPPSATTSGSTPTATPPGRRATSSKPSGRCATTNSRCSTSRTDPATRSRAPSHGFARLTPGAAFRRRFYSGEYFMRDSLGGTAGWGSRPLWIANYTNSGKPEGEYPPGADWWQFSCTHHFPGLTGEVDANYFRGTAAELLARARPGAKPKPKDEPLPPAEGGPVVLNKDGRMEVFACGGGAVSHRWQTQPVGPGTRNGQASASHERAARSRMSCMSRCRWT